MKTINFIYLVTVLIIVGCSSEKENKEESKSEESTEKSAVPEEEATEMAAPSEEEMPVENDLPTPTPISEEELKQDKIQEEQMSGKDNKVEGSGVKAKGINTTTNITVGEEGVR